MLWLKVKGDSERLPYAMFGVPEVYWSPELKMAVIYCQTCKTWELWRWVGGMWDQVFGVLHLMTLKDMLRAAKDHV